MWVTIGTVLDTLHAHLQRLGVMDEEGVVADHVAAIADAVVGHIDRDNQVGRLRWLRACVNAAVGEASGRHRAIA